MDDVDGDRQLMDEEREVIKRRKIAILENIAGEDREFLSDYRNMRGDKFSWDDVIRDFSPSGGGGADNDMFNEISGRIDMTTSPDMWADRDKNAKSLSMDEWLRDGAALVREAFKYAFGETGLNALDDEASIIESVVVVPDALIATDVWMHHAAILFKSPGIVAQITNARNCPKLCPMVAIMDLKLFSSKTKPKFLEKCDEKAFNCVFIDEAHKIQSSRWWCSGIGQTVFPMTATPPRDKRILEHLVWGTCSKPGPHHVDKNSNMYQTLVATVKLAAENGDAVLLLPDILQVDMDPVTERFQSFMTHCIETSTSRNKVGANKVYSSIYFMPWMLLDHQKGGPVSSSSSKKRQRLDTDRFIKKEGYDFVFMNPLSDQSKTLASIKDKIPSSESFDFFELAKSSHHKIDCDGTRVYVGPYIAGVIEKLELAMCTQASDPKVVIFTMFMQELELLTFIINSMRVKHEHSGQCIVAISLNGRTSRSEKDNILDQFRVPNAQERVLIMSRSYAKGLNLQAANNIIMLTVDNDVDNDKQAIYRVFRSEQTRSVRWTHVCGRSLAEKYSLEKKLGRNNFNRADPVGVMCKNMDKCLRTNV
eukprot:gene17259-biopygen26163